MFPCPTSATTSLTKNSVISNERKLRNLRGDGRDRGDRGDREYRGDRGHRGHMGHRGKRGDRGHRGLGAGRAAWADNNNISISLNIICYIMDAISTSIEINCRYYECNIKGEIRDHLCPDG